VVDVVRVVAEVVNAVDAGAWVESSGPWSCNTSSCRAGISANTHGVECRVTAVQRWW
jgi:hypothetical protein